MFSVPQDLNAIHKDVAHAGGKLVRLVEGCVVLDRGRIEHDHISKVARAQLSATYESEVLCGERGEPSNVFVLSGSLRE